MPTLQESSFSHLALSWNRAKSQRQKAPKWKKEGKISYLYFNILCDILYLYQLLVWQYINAMIKNINKHYTTSHIVLNLIELKHPKNILWKPQQLIIA